jgi:ornithine cyclodeaminase/alanine dehydrogenase-like protein (mu-crystallin family)
MLLLRETDVRAALTMRDAVHWVEQAFRHEAAGEARLQPRLRLRVPTGTLNVLPAADLALGVAGLKTYIAVGGTARFVVLLFALEGGELLAMIEADHLGMMRTGAASGVATRHMAGAAPRHTLGIIGTGWQARGQVEAVLSVCAVDEVRAFSRRAEQRAAFARWVEEELGVRCVPVASAHEAAAGASVVCTATNAATPVLAEVAPGTHVNAVGSNSLIRRELGEQLVEAAATVVVDSRAQAEAECGDLLAALQRGRLDLTDLPELSEVVSGRVPARTADTDITIFESQGLGLHDVVVAAQVYRRAREAGLGEDVPFADAAGAELLPR